MIFRSYFARTSQQRMGCSESISFKPLQNSTPTGTLYGGFHPLQHTLSRRASTRKTSLARDHSQTCRPSRSGPSALPQLQQNEGAGQIRWNFGRVNKSPEMLGEKRSRENTKSARLFSWRLGFQNPQTFHNVPVVRIWVQGQIWVE